jgi:hypothetical protein
MFWWDHEPERFDVVASAQAAAARREQGVVVGTVTTETLIRVTETLLDKRGGYLSNDILPPGAIMDNQPNWEFGVRSPRRAISPRPSATSSAARRHRAVKTRT